MQSDIEQRSDWHERGKRQNSKKRKISKINLRLFLFNLAGTFRGWLQTMLRAEQQQKKTQLHAFSCQYLINVQSWAQSGAEETASLAIVRCFPALNFEQLSLRFLRIFLMNALGENCTHSMATLYLPTRYFPTLLPISSQSDLIKWIRKGENQHATHWLWNTRF